MAAINFGNINTFGDKTVISGTSKLDTKSIIDNTIKAQEIPIDKLKDTVSVNSKKTIAFNKFNALVKAFKDSANDLRNPPQFDKSDDIFSKKKPFITSNTNVLGNNYLGFTADNISKDSSYKISNLTLAKANSSYSGGFATRSESVTAGSDTSGMFTAGTFQINDVDIIINENDSLNNIASTINSFSAETNVEANIIQVSPTNFQLVLQSTKTGAENAFTITDNDNIGFNSNTGNINWNVTDPGTDASFTFNDIPMTRPENTVKDIVTGVTFSFFQDMPDTTTEVTASITNDAQSAFDAITKFVGCYNDIRTFVAEQNKIDPETGKFVEDAVLSNDPTINTILKQIQNEITSLVKGIPSDETNKLPTTLADVGIKFITRDIEGVDQSVNTFLDIDNNALQTSLSSNFNDVKKVFQFNYFSSNSDFFITDRNNGLSTNNFSVDFDNTRAVGNQAQITYLDPITQQNVTVLGVVDPTGKYITVPPGESILLGTTSAISTPLDGLQIYFAGSPPGGKTNFSMTQGISDRIYNLTKDITSNDDSLLNTAKKAVISDSDTKNDKIKKLEVQVEANRDRLIIQFSAIENSIAKINSVLQMMEANDLARQNN